MLLLQAFSSSNPCRSMSQCIHACINVQTFSHGFGQGLFVSLCSVLKMTPVCLSVCVRKYICICICVFGSREVLWRKRSISRPHPSWSGPPYTHSSSLVLIWWCCQLDWRLVEGKNILIETLTCTGLHTHRRLFLTPSMCTLKHTFAIYYYAFNYVAFPHTSGSCLIQTCIQSLHKYTHTHICITADAALLVEVLRDKMALKRPNQLQKSL